MPLAARYTSFFTGHLYTEEEYSDCFGTDVVDSPGSVTEDSPYYDIWLHCTGEPHSIGGISIVQTKYGFWETHSHLSRDFHELGLGLYLYTCAFDVAMRDGFEVRSSLSASEEALRVWQSKTLRRAGYRITKKGKRYAFHEKRSTSRRR